MEVVVYGCCTAKRTFEKRHSAFSRPPTAAAPPNGRLKGANAAFHGCRRSGKHIKLFADGKIRSGW
jgi:hypothetical protein